MTAPMPSLHFYANDIDDLIRAVEERGVHPTETDVIVRAMKDQLAETATAQREAREARTYRVNGEAEELVDLRDELARAKDRIADLEIRLHDARRKVR
jgi:hypothetical protein